MTFKSIYPALSSRPLITDNQYGGAFRPSIITQLNFSTSTWIIVGACLQALAVYLFSSGSYVLLISTLVLLFKIGRTVLQTVGILPNPYMEDVFNGRSTALMHDAQSGEITGASDRKIAILHLGSKSNHPLGYVAPQYIKLGDWADKMYAEFDKGNVPGYLGQSTFHRFDAKGAPENVAISYWESIEDIWNFAYSPVHKDAWQWWEKEIKSNGYIGINHEIFEADAKNWETIYVNFQPTLMGATTYLVKDGKMQRGVVPDKWVSPLVDARRGPLAKSSGRLGRPIQPHDEKRVAKELYE